MENKENKQNEKDNPMQENPKHDFEDYYIQKMDDGYYKSFSRDGTERKDIYPSINYALRTLRLGTPMAVTVYYNPSDREIEIEPALAVFRERYQELMNRNPNA